jgi:cytochrome c peroxidase
MPETGFTGPVSELNRTTGAYPGSVRTRFSDRKPQTHAYAPLSPVLHYNPGRATSSAAISGTCVRRPPAGQSGRRAGEGPPTNPVEMGLPDIACAVYRASQRPYRALFESVWGPAGLRDRLAERMLSRSATGPGRRPPASRCRSISGPIDRGRAASTFDQMAQSIAGYEASAEVTSFTSKYDAVLAGKAKFTPQEQTGYDLFRGKAQCNTCHRDGGPGEDPLFTDFTASNIGTPANPRLPYYAEDRPDAFGYVANPAGPSFVDGGVGTFLAKGICSASPRRWMRDGSSWRRTTRRECRCRRCAMSTSGRTRPS